MKHIFLINCFLLWTLSKTVYAEFAFKEDFDLPYDTSSLAVFGGAGGWVEQASGRLHCWLPNDLGPSYKGAGLVTKFDLVGDFDVTVEYQLHVYALPPEDSANHTVLGVWKRSSSGHQAAVGRHLHLTQGGYHAWHSNLTGNVGISYTTDESGTIRARRIGDTLIFDAPGLTGTDVFGSESLAIFISGWQGKGGGLVHVSFDNLQIVADGVSFFAEVSNLTAGQRRDDSKLIDICYDLATENPHGCTVSVEVSDDAGSTYTVPATSFTGDIGPRIAPGTGKHIIWDCKADLPGVAGSNYKVRVIADDGQ